MKANVATSDQSRRLIICEWTTNLCYPVRRYRSSPPARRQSQHHSRAKRRLPQTARPSHSNRPDRQQAGHGPCTPAHKPPPQPPTPDKDGLRPTDPIRRRPVGGTGTRIAQPALMWRIGAQMASGTSRSRALPSPTPTLPPPVRPRDSLPVSLFGVSGGGVRVVCLGRCQCVPLAAGQQGGRVPHGDHARRGNGRPQ